MFVAVSVAWHEADRYFTQVDLELSVAQIAQRRATLGGRKQIPEHVLAQKPFKSRCCGRYGTTKMLRRRDVFQSQPRLRAWQRDQ